MLSKDFFERIQYLLAGLHDFFVGGERHDVWVLGSRVYMSGQTSQASCYLGKWGGSLMDLSRSGLYGDTAVEVM